MGDLEFQARHRYPDGFRLDLAFTTNKPVTAIFGPSGSGKTTILEMIAGLRAPEEGRIGIGGRTLFDSASRQVVSVHRRKVGVVFQDLLLFPHLSIEGNLLYGRRRCRSSNIAYERLVHVLELTDLLGRHPKGLSGGERQRVALGRALLSGPELLLLDEPLTALDEALKIRVLAYVERVVAEWRIPTLFVSHVQTEVRRLADWVVVIDRGQKIGEGTPDDALARPQALTWRDSSGPMNLLRIEDVRFTGSGCLGRVGTQFMQLPADTTPTPGPVFVQFAPSAVLLSRHDISDVSARNHLRGTIRHIVELPAGVFVAVDVGQIVWVVVTSQAEHQLELVPGAEVVCLIKTHALGIVG